MPNLAPLEKLVQGDSVKVRNHMARVRSTGRGGQQLLESTKKLNASKLTSQVVTCKIDSLAGRSLSVKKYLEEHRECDQVMSKTESQLDAFMKVADQFNKDYQIESNFDSTLATANQSVEATTLLRDVPQCEHCE